MGQSRHTISLWPFTRLIQPSQAASKLCWPQRSHSVARRCTVKLRGILGGFSGLGASWNPRAVKRQRNMSVKTHTMKTKKRRSRAPPPNNARSLISLHTYEVLVPACTTWKYGLIGTARHMVAATTPRHVSGGFDSWCMYELDKVMALITAAMGVGWA